MRFKLALKGDLVRAMKAEEARIARAVTAAIDDVSAFAQGEYREQVGNALGQRTAKTVRKKRFPRTPSIGAAAIVYSRAGDIVAGFERGSVITPQGRFLAIPTRYNRQGGRRQSRLQRSKGVWAGCRVTPQEMVDSKLAFVLPAGDGSSLVWCLKVTRAQQRRGKRGRIRDLAFAGAMLAVGTGHSRRSDSSVSDILAQGYVPMFTLVPQVRLEKKISLAKVAYKAGQRLPRQIRHNLETFKIEE